jgi:transportin-1
MIPHNPSGAISHFPYLCDALVEYKNPSPELEQVFGALLRCFKQGIGQEWNNYFAKFPLELRKQLNSRFNL